MSWVVVMADFASHASGPRPDDEQEGNHGDGDEAQGAAHARRSGDRLTDRMPRLPLSTVRLSPLPNLGRRFSHVVLHERVTRK